jgi:hypothetical protein
MSGHWSGVERWGEREEGREEGRGGSVLEGLVDELGPVTDEEEIAREDVVET